LTISNSHKGAHSSGTKGVDAEVFGSVQPRIPVVSNKMGMTVVFLTECYPVLNPRGIRGIIASRVTPVGGRFFFVGKDLL